MVDSTVSILLVEDDDVTAESVIRSLRKHEVDWPVVVAEDGGKALEILRAGHASQRIDKPHLVLLDLNMPGMNGFEFLQALRVDPLLRETVVFILTTSNSEADRARAYQECIAGYLVKSDVGPQFSKLARLLLEYRSAVTFP
jgi:CheY-like chemotaxis protein